MDVVKCTSTSAPAVFRQGSGAGVTGVPGGGRVR